MKEGWKTTEFWVTVVTSLIGLTAALGFLTPEQSTGLSSAVIQVGGLVATVLASFGYSVSRGSAKINGT